MAPHAITRRSIPFGPEVTDSERKNNKTERERGLAFVCYQSSIDNGFEFIQVCTSIMAFNDILSYFSTNRVAWEQLGLIMSVSSSGRP